MKKGMKDIFLKLIFNILEKNLHELHNDLPFLPGRIKIEKLVGNLQDKNEYITHIRNLNHKLVFKKVYKVIKFNQNA